MDELNNGEQGQYVEPGKNEKKNNTRKIVKRTLLTAGLALAVYMVYSIVYPVSYTHLTLPTIWHV